MTARAGQARIAPQAWQPWAVLACAAALSVAGQARADDYTDMLGYLAQTRIDDHALAGAKGAIAVNMAAGDLNLQSNLQALAVGDAVSMQVGATQRRSADVYDTPQAASATIGGSALAGASGIASINQASGSGNAEQNAVALGLAQQGIRETPDSLLSSSVSASAEQQPAPVQAAGKTVVRKVAVEATALGGFEGVLQLNQIAGSANQIGNQLVLSVSGGP